MIQRIFKILLTFNSTSIILVVYLIKEKYILGKIHWIFYDLHSYFSYLLYLIIPLYTTYISLKISNKLISDSQKKGSIIDIEQANNSFLPSYLGYFFVSLGISDLDTLLFVYIILFVFTYISQTLYFNPIFLLFNYHFYNITTNNNVQLFLISKKLIKNASEAEFKKLKRINNFTFIDKE